MAQARKEPDREYFGKRDLLIASDVPMKKPVDGHIHQKFLSKMTYKGDLPCREIRNALKETQLKTVLAREFVVLAAKPGEELAAKVPPADGDHGRDMFGNTTDRAGKPKDVQLRAGSNVEIVDDKAIAQIFGYVYAMNNIIAVISPVWISPDCLEAHFIHFPTPAPRSSHKRPGSVTCSNLYRWSASLRNGRSRPSFATLRSAGRRSGTSSLHRVRLPRPAGTLIWSGASTRKVWKNC